MGQEVRRAHPIDACRDPEDLYDKTKSSNPIG